MKKFTLLLFTLLLHQLSFSQIPAFPGAEGFGSDTWGGRDGKVIKVTNLNDHGVGSLREALEETEGPRIIVFTIGGIINLETSLKIKHPWVTIAGQTAPGGGICLRGNALSIETHDVIIRFMRFRPGDINFGPENQWDLVDAINIGHPSNEVSNIVIDHCTLSWAVDEVVGIWFKAHDITIQNCIIAEGLTRSKHPTGPHSMGMLIGSRATNISIHHNIFAHNNDRNPHINGPSIVDFRNNIIYNPGGIASDIRITNGQITNYVNNYIKKGPDTKIPADIVITNVGNQSAKLHISGNIGISSAFKPLYYSDNAKSNLLQYNGNPQINNINQSDAHSVPSVTTLSALQAYDYVLQEAGAILPRRDAFDEKLINDIINSKGRLVTSKNHLLEWPPLQSGLALLDSDNDGMPDHWEERYSLDVEVDDSAKDKDGDGYTNIEEFLNKTDPTQPEGTKSSDFVPLSDNSNRLASYTELDLEIEQNYPNPYSDETHIEFSIDQSSDIVIRVVDNEGREIVELVNSFLYEGKYHILWDSSTVDPGMYQIFIASKDKVKSIKTILTR